MFLSPSLHFNIDSHLNRLFNSSLVILGLMFIFLLTACQKEVPAPVERAAPSVTVSKPLVKTIKEYSIFTGSTVAFGSADVVARVAGELESADFVASSRVKAGDLLFTIEKEKYQAQRDIDRALLQSARAELALASTEVKRMEQASKNQAVSELDVDKSKASRDVAIAKVKSAQASLAASELNLSYTNVVSPIDGVVSRSIVDVGNVVGNEGPTLLTRVNAMQPMYVYFNVPESSVLNMLDSHSDRRSGEQKTDNELNEIDKSNRNAFVERANETGFPHEGFIDYIDNEVDMGTGTVDVRVQLSNEDDKFFPGLFVRVKVPGDDINDAILVKEAAIGSDLGGKYVLTVGEGNIVSLIYITLGSPQANGFVHVLSGLEGDETYIVNGILRARPGLPVQPKPAPSEKEEG
jgi:RND family efflux transporter MFP subunit